nr:NADH dehydrogenase subunit 6 [Dascyllus albisella]
MANFLLLYMFGFVTGMVGVASNPSPYFAAFWLVLVAAMGCLMLSSQGGCFLSLVLFLVYLGGMLVVFAFAAALSAERYPYGWGSWAVLRLVLLYASVVMGSLYLLSGEWYGVYGASADEFAEFSLFRGDTAGVALMYSAGGGMLVLAAWVLLLTLFVVLELTRGLSRGALRAV